MLSSGRIRAAASGTAKLLSYRVENDQSFGVRKDAVFQILGQEDSPSALCAFLPKLRAQTGLVRERRVGIHQQVWSGDVWPRLLLSAAFDRTKAFSIS